MTTKEAIAEIERLADLQNEDRLRANAAIFEALRWLDEGASGRARESLTSYLEDRQEIERRKNAPA